MSNPTEEAVYQAPTRPLVFDKTIEDPTSETEIREPEVYRDVREPVSEMPEDLEAAELDNLSMEELRKHQEEVQRKIQEKLDQEKQAVIKQIVDVVNQFDISVEELVDALGGLKIKRKGVKAVQKYRDPKTGATWSGRGKEPAWIRDQDRSKFLNPDAEEE